MKHCLTSKLAAFLFHKICMNQMVSPKRGELVQLEIHLTWWPWRVVGGHLLAEPGRLLSPPLLAQWWSLAQMANVGRLGLAGWRSAIRHPLASPCHCNLLLIPNPTPSHNVEMPLASGSRLRLIFQLELFEAVSLIHPSRPDSEREEKEGKIAIFCLYWPAGFFWPLCISTA